MFIIGLCGGSGSGKSTVSRIFSEYNIPVIDADAVYSELTYPSSALIHELEDTFGSEITDSGGALKRNVLSKMVFGKGGEEKLKKLNLITHRAVIQETEKKICKYEEDGIPLVVFDAPLLFESGFDKKCDTIIAVISDREERIKRIILRDHIDRCVAERRISSQTEDEFLRENSDFIIVNNGTLEELRKAALAVAEKIIENMKRGNLK